VLIRAVAILNKKYGHLVFVIVGTIFKNQRQYFSHLQNLCSHLAIDNVEFVGGRADVRPLLQRFDIYVCSSCSETGPMTLFEAMSMEKAVVSTDVGDVSTYVKDGINGFVVNVGDKMAMAERLATLVDDEAMRRKFGYKARQVVIQELDIKKCARRHLNAYTQILSGERLGSSA